MAASIPEPAAVPASIVSRFRGCHTDFMWDLGDAVEKHPDGDAGRWVRSLGTNHRESLSVASAALAKAVARERLLALKTKIENPEPYGRAELAGLPRDSHNLVPLSAFQPNAEGILLIGDAVVNITPTLPALNSMHWAVQALSAVASKGSIKIRLDPFQVVPRKDYSAPFFKMTVYGRPLDWARLANLKEPEHGRMMPDNPADSDVAFTDFVWSPRDDGVHFICEEVPNPDSITYRASRYFHSIYDPATGSFCHADGALRIFDGTGVSQRLTAHVRDAGKAGTRVKAFQFDGAMPRDGWCNLVAAFFVWNPDVEDYFS